MGDSLERLYQAVIAAKDLDPAFSRTARLFQRARPIRLAEEAIEVASAVAATPNGGPRAPICSIT
jgi:phosphoribosyl-ATP pyrophosphohydrolase